MFLNLQLQKIAPDYFTNGLPSLETGNMSPPPFLFPPLTTLTTLHPSFPSSLHPVLLTPPACYSINQWPPPRPGQVLQLPLLGQLIHVRQLSFISYFSKKYTSFSAYVILLSLQLFVQLADKCLNKTHQICMEYVFHRFLKLNRKDKPCFISISQVSPHLQKVKKRQQLDHFNMWVCSTCVAQLWVVKLKPWRHCFSSFAKYLF